MSTPSVGTLVLAMPTVEDGLFHTSSPSGRIEYCPNHSGVCARSAAARRPPSALYTGSAQIKARACLDVVSAALLHCFQFDAINASNPKQLFFSSHVDSEVPS